MSRYETIVSKLIQSGPSGINLRGNAKLDNILMYTSVFAKNKESPPSIVVAGTKGKGSTCAVIESILRKSGLKTGLFTSPHLCTPRERIQINGQKISRNEYVDAYEEVMKRLHTEKLKIPPFFGIHTLMSRLFFDQKKIDVAVVECGIGGRYDWTQIYHPMLSIITHLEFDHTDILGSTPESIAWNKAGIMKPGVQCFKTLQNYEWDAPLNRYANEIKAPLKFVGPFWDGETGLKGPTAIENTSLGVVAAKYACEKLGVLKPKIVEGAKNACIRGRYQSFTDKYGYKWLLDGAHTLDSMINCEKWYLSTTKDTKNDVLICATTKKRDANTILAPLARHRYKKILYVKGYSNQKPPEGFVEVQDLKEAILIARNARPDNILVSGSLHLVGDILGIIEH